MSTTQRIGRFLILAILLSSFVYISECLLFLSNRFFENKPPPENIDFATQYLHPYYFYFFPTSPNALNKVNQNGEIVWIDKRGFGGGVGPEKKGNRKLAFLVGGSTAFGDRAPHPSQTIAPYLNELQKEYFFVNAGVPSWNSFQELLRILKQIIPYKPVLIVSLTGFNDINNSFERRERMDIPRDSPENFEDLYSWVENIRSEEFRDGAVRNYLTQHTLWGTFKLYNLRKKISDIDLKEKLSKLREKMGVISLHDLKLKLGITSAEEGGTNVSVKKGRPDSKRGQVDLMGEIATATSDKLAENLEYAHRISRAYNCEFLAVLQPYKFLHPEYYKYKEKLFPDFYRRVAENVLEKDREYIKDLTIPFKDLEREELETYYSDRVHFTAIGYKRMAEEILRLIRQR